MYGFSSNRRYNDQMYRRLLDLPLLLQKKSFFLFGPRSTGKTTLVKQIPCTRFYDLLDALTFQRLVKRPSLLDEEHRGENIVVIDEIQKFPPLLDEVHRLIEKKKYTFLLTGSSARKLKGKGVNLLAGRAWWASLFPLTSPEISDFDLLRYLNRGGLPQVYDSPDYREELLSYTGLYLREEVQQEALTRNIPAFSEFLELMALSNGQEINYDGFSRDLQISPTTLKNYIGILNDTLLGFPLAGYTGSKKRKAISRFKYYLFDLGVTNCLSHRGGIEDRSELFGKAFEHFIILEIRAFISYHRMSLQMFYWRSTSKFEVDLIIEKWAAIEIKSTSMVQDKHLKGLRAFKEEGLVKEYFVISQDLEHRVTSDGIHIFPWPLFLQKLWGRSLRFLFSA
ncbi:MAG: AAA family ATPase [Bacteriovoracales bacterium]|nr:AAA family ATPase [Bacteriovoracales bacterium]